MATLRMQPFTKVFLEYQAVTILGLKRRENPIRNFYDLKISILSSQPPLTTTPLPIKKR